MADFKVFYLFITIFISELLYFYQV